MDGEDPLPATAGKGSGTVGVCSGWMPGDFELDGWMLRC